MTLLQLKYFQTLAYVLHYTRAAAALHIAQPSLSYAISELEKELGVKLFKRDGRKICLTDAGREFLLYVEKALDLIGEGTTKIRTQYKENCNKVRLGYFYSLSGDFIPRVVSDMYGGLMHDGITITYSQAIAIKVLEKIRSGEIDLGFTLHTADDMISLPMFYQKIYLVVPLKHPLAQKEHVSIKDFLREPIIVMDKTSNLGQIVRTIYKNANAVPNIVFEVGECSAPLPFVARGMAISILPMVPTFEAIPVKYIDVDDPNFRRMTYLTWLKGKTFSSAAEKVKNYLLTHYSVVGVKASS